MTALKSNFSIGGYSGRDMMIRWLDLLDRAEDEPLEFDNRYKRKRNSRKHDLYSAWIEENRQALKPMPRSKRMEYFFSLFTSDKILGEYKGPVVGTFCNIVPEELIYAAGARPVRLCSGCNHAVGPAEDSFPRDSCPLVKAALGFAVTDSPFVSLCDAIVIPATCDAKKKLGEVLNDYKPVWMLNLPQDKERSISKRYWLSEIRILKNRLQSLTGQKITSQSLKDAILMLRKRHSASRKLLKLRNRISGREAMLVNQAAFFDDIIRWTQSTEQLCRELETKNPLPGPKILLTGAPTILPNFKIPNIIEEHAHIAMDMTCAGSQYHYDPVEVDEWNMHDMMRAIAERYLMPSVCPCFIKGEDRLDKLMDMVKEYHIDGVIYHTLRLCLLFDVESGRTRSVMEQKRIPFLQLSTDYSREDMGQLKTRIEAFAEILESR
jgi:benzoyl-CoA reductase/2-hydroxyglutaryl-CoA dehydratase subunit BcrC/BadD/HgdB